MMISFGVLLLSVGTALVYLALLIIGIDDVHAAAKDVDLSDSGTVELVGARGDEVALALKGESVGGHWSTDGIRVELDGVDKKDLDNPVAGPKDQNWGDTISFATDTEGFEVRASFDVPDVGAAETQTLRGAVRGSVYYPQESGGGFTNATDSVDVPISLLVVPQGDPRRAAKGNIEPVKERLKSRGLRLLAAFTIGLIAFVLWIVFAPKAAPAAPAGRETFREWSERQKRERDT